jgi:hypothetical protein
MSSRYGGFGGGSGSSGSTQHPDSFGDLSLNIILWLILPNLITSIIQRVYYGFRYRVNSTQRPKPGSSKFQRHHNNIYIFVVGTYLLFCIFQVVYNLPSNYYDEFGVRVQFSEKELKSKFRKYSLQYHPDRNPGEDAQARFMRLRKIYETLSNPLLREAYNKFGVMKHCLNCIIFKDYLMQGMTEFLAFYGGTGLVLVILNMLGSTQFARYWRFMSYFSLAALEAVLLVLPYDPFAWFMPNYTVAEKISILHQSVIYIFIALSQFGPIIFPDDHQDLRQALSKLEKDLDLQVNSMKKQLKNTFQPFSTNQEMLAQLKRQMQKHSVNMRLYEHDSDYRSIRVPRSQISTGK